MLDTHPRGLGVLRAILAFSVLSTLAHYSHNFFEVDQYPNSLVSDSVTQVLTLISWPLLTAIGIWGYRQYAAGRFRQARGALVAYSFTGLITPGHFLSGNPDIPAFFYATIFTDFVAGVAVLTFVVWSARREPVAAAGPPG
jgi:hypothetical protein